MNPRRMMMPKTQKTKHEEAITRDEANSKLTIQQKINKLDKKLGKGVGAVKQRAKYAKQAEAEKKGKKS